MILLAIPAVALTLVSLAAFFGRWSWLLDVLANFRVQYAAVLVFMAGFLFLGRWRRTGFVALLGVVLNLAVIVPLFVGEGSTIPPERPLTVLSFNLFGSNEQFGEVAGYIRELQPDVVFLHEASRPWEIAMEAAELAYVITRSRTEEHIFGTLVLSREGDTVISHGMTVNAPRAVEVVHDGVAMLGIHPLAPATARTSSLRNAQLGFAANWSNRQEQPHLVVGDFNATPWSYPFRRILTDTDLVNSQRGFGIQASFPADQFVGLRVPIDHLLHSPDVVVADRRLGPSLGSDHFPLIVELWLPG